MKPLIAAILFAVSLFWAAPPCEGAQWVWYYSAISPPGGPAGPVTIREFLDTSTTEKTPQGTVRLWMKGTVEGDPRNTLESVQRFVEMNCAARKYRILKTTRYYKDNRTTDDAAAATPWQEFTPGSNWESLSSLLEPTGTTPGP